ncbi:hypothetical protein ETN89_12530 [Photobacterium damselae subsp. damselae]|uniref:hypothetical protein n=1 Tax=Photobacterium damselae TaxID=38293 RepID=UPI000A2FA562|nr:hypothetical protein [Photobacterium damselae]ARR49392.1 hypothetical protein CAY62_07245 [Photobacterium damselae subsp. damselae]QAY36059.1 hypothetical protein ETN89_12530 [Photobacterium damselae subsp. damselae]
MDSVMEQPPQRKILFSYTNFLANSNPKSITFIEAFKELISTFECVRQHINIDEFDTLAGKVLSTNASDVMNLSRLVELAREADLDELVITMPYGLDEAQLHEIEALAQCRIHLQDDDKENIIIYLTD